jgi:DNA-directed RNA polymerase specialized sigma subunit
MMAKQYWNILLVKETVSRHPEAGELAQRLGMSLWNIKKLMEQAKGLLIKEISIASGSKEDKIGKRIDSVFKP